MISPDASTVRILRVVPTIDSAAGGPSNSAVNAAISEAKRGFRVTLVTTVDHAGPEAVPAGAKRLTEAGVTVHLFPRPRFARSGAWGLSGPLLGWMLRNVAGFDIVHLHYVWTASTVIGSLAAGFAGVPVVLTGHESLTRYDIDITSGSRQKRKAKRLLRRVVMSRVSVVVCASELEAADSIEEGERARVIPHPVIESVPEDSGDGVSGDFTVGYLGRIHPKKGIDDLLRAVAIAPDRESTVVICGDGDPALVSRLRELQSSLGLDRRVEWWGHVDAAGKARLFARCDLMAMPSEYECFGMAGAEALAAGLPLLVTERTGIAPIVGEYRCGSVVPHRDVEALAEAIGQSQGASPDDRMELRSNALRAARERLTFTSYGERIFDLYTDLLYPSGR